MSLGRRYVHVHARRRPRGGRRHAEPPSLPLHAVLASGRWRERGHGLGRIRVFNFMFNVFFFPNDTESTPIRRQREILFRTDRRHGCGEPVRAARPLDVARSGALLASACWSEGSTASREDPVDEERPRGLLCFVSGGPLGRIGEARASDRRAVEAVLTKRRSEFGSLGERSARPAGSTERCAARRGPARVEIDHDGR